MTAKNSTSRRSAAAMAAMAPLTRFLDSSPYSRRRGQPGICDFTFGNPHEPALPGFVDALRRWIEPAHADWYAYTESEPRARAAIASRLEARHGLAFEPEDVAMTTGSFGAIATAFGALLDPGDEVVYSLPPWFCYESMLVYAGAVPIKVPVRQDDFDLDLQAIEGAITERTRMVIVNTPNNPTGRIYPAATLARLAEILDRASARNGSPVFLLSDESYSRIVFDQKTFHSPIEHYARTLVSYTYGKVLLTPGARLGYLALHPDMPERDEVRAAVRGAAIAAGWMFPNAVLQYAADELEDMSIDMAALARRRDRLMAELRAIGYQVHAPEGTFYLLPKSPIADDQAFTELLAEYDVFALPGTVCEIPGYFRLSLTASDDMVDKSIAGFTAAFARANQ